VANKKDHQQNEFLNFDFDENNEVARYVIDSAGNRILQEIADGGSTLSTADLIGMTRSAGFSDGESYDKIEAGNFSLSQQLLEYSLAGVCQFQIEIIDNGGGSFSITKRICTGFLLQEDGFKILQENGDALLAQGLIA